MPFERTFRKRSRTPEIIALINVIFLLLVFFMVAGKFEPFEPLEVDLPQAAYSKVIEPGQISVVVAADGQITVNREFVLAADLESAIAAELEKNSGAVVSIRADAGMDAARMIDAMQAARRAGASGISITTQSAVTED